jgi:trehalose synthase-fused probable maltokinase
VAEIHHGATLTPTKQALIEGWIGAQRWYAAKGSTPRTRRLRSFRFDDPAGEVGIATIIVADESGPDPVVYQVPLTYRGAPVDGLEHALVGTMEHSVLGTRWVYDACHDPVYATQLVSAIQGGVRAVSSSETDTVDPSITGTRHPQWLATATVRSAKVLTGEQSNTSIILDCETDDGASKPLICKLFRMVQPGHNPDVELQSALRSAGSDRVPEVVGQLTGTWADGSGEDVEFDLAFAQEFLPGTRDAWREALDAVNAGTDFSASARALGEATAEVHVALAESFGTEDTTHEAGSRLMSEMRRRARSAAAQAAQLDHYLPRIDALYADAAEAPWPPLQRIHGDYHLGQVLHSAQRGWILLDFEGEPMRPLAERRRPDQWLRDVAGMLRSFDYAGGSAEQSDPDRSARDWVEACRTAFLEGYAEQSGTDPRSYGSVLTAFELDKALYEVVYEAANRPTWITIPLQAIDRLLATDPAGNAARSPAPQEDQ